jgi:hypothetical protein
MELTGAIRQTNEAPNVRTLGHQSHRSPAISTRTPGRSSVLAALAADCRLLTTAKPRLRYGGKVYERSSHNGHGISPQFILSSLFILRNPTGCTTIAAPPRPVPAITRFKSLSHQLFVDLSVLRLILQVRTGSRCGHLWLLNCAPCANPAMPLRTMGPPSLPAASSTSHLDCTVLSVQCIRYLSSCPKSSRIRTRNMYLEHTRMHLGVLQPMNSAQLWGNARSHLR